MKQEATNDDGYENSVNHFDMRAHGQNEQGGKVNQNMMDQHIPTAPQGVALDHRLQMRRPLENHLGQENVRINSVDSSHIDNRLSDVHSTHDPGMNHHQVERENRINSLEGRLNGSESNRGHENHLTSIETRLVEHDNSVNSIESTINGISGGGIQNNENSLGNHESRLLNQESQISRVENRLDSIENHRNPMEAQMGHDSQMSDNESGVVGSHESRIGSQQESQMTRIENRVRHENHLSNIESRIMAQSSHHLAALENRLGHENHLNSLEKRISNRETNHLNELESRMNGHENCINGLEGRLNSHDGHLGTLDGRMLAHENRLLESRMESRDNHLSSLGVHDSHLNGLENRLSLRENHISHQDSRMSGHGHGHGLTGMDARDSILNAHANHMGLHMSHPGPLDHLQPHPHLQSLHHPHHPHLHHMHHPHHSHSHVKCDSMEDPYSFVEDDPTGMGGASHVTPQPRPSPIMLQAIPKKRGRKKKIKPENELGDTVELLKKENGLMKSAAAKERKKHDRFNGMPEEEVVKRTLPDHLTTNLDIVIIGINPGLFAAYKGHHYAGPGNHFWKCLYLSGLTPEPMTADDDYKLLSVGIGFTNMVARATKGSADLTRKEIKEGSQILLEKLQKFKPKIAVFNGKLIYEVFSGNKDFNFGRQPDFVDGTNTYMWVMPSSSARCAQLPRAADKVPFYAALKKFRDYLNGLIAELDENEVVFNDQKLKTFYESDINVESKDDQGSYYSYSRLANNDLTDLSNAVVKKEPYDPGRPEKKKRGRPKKIKINGVEVPPPKERIKKEKLPVDGDIPKKKRGRPKKIKSENGGIGAERRMLPQNVSIQNGSLNVSEHTSSSNPASTCFSPPIQSPSGFCPGFSPAYASQNQNPVSSQFNPRAPSPAYHPSPHHPSPLPTQYSQSPPPASQSQSQPFTHSDLSSEISAAISSEHLGSPPPTSPSLGPPDFEPPTSMPEDTATMSVKEEPEPECRFSSPAPSEPAPYQYRAFSEANIEHKNANSQFQRQSSPEFASKRANQDVSSKSLSGLESLVDQIPSIAEGGSGNSVSGTNTEGFESQHSGQYEDYLGYPGYSTAPAAPTPQSAYPHYTSSTNYSTAGYLPPSQSSFSVSSLANSASHGHEPQVASSFSVSSLASNYTAGGYPNLMGAPHLVVPQPGLFPTGMNMTPNYQYPSQYPGGPTSFPYSPHALHVPSPNYPPYGPYSNSSYPQPYLANHVLDRIKQERMDIGFGSF
ncbi:G/t mismatch-specific thymine DNA glycosylase, putative [Pediculus humanus corporis]|uniref:G/T mismatch-specific thymine DNA glycosylase n=1 Tax=Pediculus humanus subsp. corporis TaxID=121224 RepID=E0VM66_PEDHC|nr:G/t mismatch-specific thymine DNA glycosylase, putative [Pediculus humanus corporis]EEB14472.1 G/t mismatch-specific thymine DNA glycosylase, putative [Pediculus humanus corporis]